MVPTASLKRQHFNLPHSPNGAMAEILRKDYNPHTQYGMPFASCLQVRSPEPAPFFGTTVILCQ
jgi:hypothetical protein